MLRALVVVNRECVDRFDVARRGGVSEVPTGFQEIDEPLAMRIVAGGGEVGLAVRVVAVVVVMA